MSNNLELLYGHGVKENIVATEVVKDKSNIVEVFYRDGDEVWSEYITYKPFLYLNDEDSIFDELYEDTEVEKLLGSLHYNRILHFGDNADYMWWIKKNADDAFAPFTQSQWMIQSGQTQFKGMDFDDPLRMYCDIEVVTKKGYDFPNSSRDEDKITIISMWTNRGDAFILALNEDGQTPRGEDVYRCKSEKVLLEKWVRVVRNVDPDIMVWHNVNFDMPYIRDRAQMLGVDLKLGRNGSEPNSFMTTIKFAEKSDDYENFQIYGRHILDTLFMAKSFDFIARTLDNYRLKYCADFLGGIGGDRTYIKGDEIADVWRGEHGTHTRGDLIKYALDDVKETQLLDREWGRSIFQSTKMLPLPMQDVARYGTGNKFDLLMERQYYKYNWSLPKADEREDFGGGYANTFKFGYYG